jgi:predicted ATP-grasp superfamily ATP-dependent carboligase
MPLDLATDAASSFRRRPPETVSVLLSEGSSLSSRQTISALGPLGYQLDVCDSNPFCLSRFSRFVRHFYSCPAWAEEPEHYLEYILKRIELGRYDVLLPVHEQAFLFAAAKDQLGPKVGIALTEFHNFALLQSKADFARLLAHLGLPQPPTMVFTRPPQLEAVGDFPYYVKAPFSTAGCGVWRINNPVDRSAIINSLKSQGVFDGTADLVVQAVACGKLSQAQAIFEHGRLIAIHCTSQMAEGLGGSQSARLSVNHSIVREHLEKLGDYLGWHGALALDYFFDPAKEQPVYIEANPRLVEPMNATVSGVNLAEILVRLSTGESFGQGPVKTGRFGVRTHSVIATLLGLAGRGGSRWQLLCEAGKAVFRRGIYEDSKEDLTPMTNDWQSLMPLIFVGSQLLLSPSRAKAIARRAVATYALTPETVEKIYSLEKTSSETYLQH